MHAAIGDRRSTVLLAYVRRCITVDARSLAVFRMGVALLIIADVLLRSRNFFFYYTDDGILPQHLTQLYLRDGAVSIFFFTSNTQLIAALFAVHVLVALVLLIGYKTRLMTIISFVFVISLDHHNPFVLSYADTLFRMLLFWAIFLPLGERWSVDALQRDRTPRSSVASLATAAIMVQMVFMYLTNALYKYPSSLWHSGEAAIIALGADEITILLGKTAIAFQTFLQMSGRLWFFLLVCSPLLILLVGRARYPVIALLAAGHLSFALTVRIGAFPYVALLGLLVFVQPMWWADARSVVEQVAGKPVLPVGVTHSRGYGNRLASLLPGEVVSFRGRDQVIRRTLSVIVVVAMIGLLVHPGIVLIAEESAAGDPEMVPANPADNVAANWGIAQPTWDIFANPGPREYDRYFVFPAKTTDGHIFDIYNEREMTYERPGDALEKQYDTYRERFFMNTVSGLGDDTLISESLSQHLCDTWEEEHGIEIQHINMYEVREDITIETADDPANRKRSASRFAMTECGTRGGEVFALPEDYGFDE